MRSRRIAGLRRIGVRKLEIWPLSLRRSELGHCQGRYAPTPAGTSAPTGTLPDSLYSVLAMQPWGVSATYSISANNPPSDVGQPTTTLDPTQAITFPSAVPLASLNPLA